MIRYWMLEWEGRRIEREYVRRMQEIAAPILKEAEARVDAVLALYSAHRRGR